LGPDRDTWEDYDACALVEARGWKGPALLVEQGASDAFLQTQLKPELLQQACERAGVALDLRLRAGYDHSYFFIASFIESHLRFHAQHL
jgi:S-formylglutathione hydrolase